MLWEGLKGLGDILIIFVGTNHRLIVICVGVLIRRVGKNGGDVCGLGVSLLAGLHVGTFSGFRDFVGKRNVFALEKDRGVAGEMIFDIKLSAFVTPFVSGDNVAFVVGEFTDICAGRRGRFRGHVTAGMIQ